MSKKTDISDEDKALFAEAVRGVKRLKSDKVHFAKSTPKRSITTIAEEQQPQFHLSDPFDTTITAEQRLFYAKGGLRPRLLSQLRQGKLAVEAYLDLHGETIDQARDSVIDFLSQAHDRGCRCVRIIHGKGTRSEGQSPKLKNHVHHWLNQIPFVLAYSSCQPKHGGMGAVYILLATKRQ